MFSRSLCLFYLALLSFIDFHRRRLPDCIVLSLFFTVFCFDISFSFDKIPLKLLVSFFIFLIFAFVLIVTHGLGGGDIKLAAALFYCLGFFDSLLVFIVACFSAVIAFLLFHLRGKKIKRMPFAPFLAFGYLFAQVSGRNFL